MHSYYSAIPASLATNEHEQTAFTENQKELANGSTPFSTIRSQIDIELIRGRKIMDQKN